MTCTDCNVVRIDNKIEEIRLIPLFGNEIVIKIFSYFSAADLLRFRAVSRAWEYQCPLSVTIARCDTNAHINDDAFQLAANRENVFISELPLLRNLDTLLYINKKGCSGCNSFLSHFTRLATLTVYADLQWGTWRALDKLTKLACYGSLDGSEAEYLPPKALRERMKTLRIFQLVDMRPSFAPEELPPAVTNLHFPTSLTALSLQRCKSFLSPTVLLPLVHLRTLSIGGTIGMNNDGLTHLTKLVELDIANARGAPQGFHSYFPGPSLSGISSLTNLVYIHIARYSPKKCFSPAAVAPPISSFPYLYQLRISVSTPTRLVGINYLAPDKSDVVPLFPKLWASDRDNTTLSLEDLKEEKT